MTKHNLPKCLAWLLQQDFSKIELKHISNVSSPDEVIPDRGIIADEASVSSQEMARLRLAPHAVTKPRMLAQQPSNGLLTPAPSNSPSNPPVAPKSNITAEVHRTPNIKLMQPKTPMTIYDDSVFDIDEIDDFLDEPLQDLTTSSYGDFGTPTKLWTEASASRVEPLEEKRGKKRSSAEFAEDRTSLHKTRSNISPSNSSKRRSLGRIDFSNSHGDQEDIHDGGRYISVKSNVRPESEIKYTESDNHNQSLDSGLQVNMEGNGVQKLFQHHEISDSKFFLEDQEERVDRTPSEVLNSRNHQINSFDAFDSTDHDGVLQSPPKGREATVPLVQKPLATDAPYASSTIQDPRSQRSPTTKSSKSISSIYSAQSHNVPALQSLKQNITQESSSSPASSGSATDKVVKLSKVDRQKLINIMNVPEEQCNGLLQEYEEKKRSLARKMAEELVEDEVISPELQKENQFVRTRIVALEKLIDLREPYQNLRATEEGLKVKLSKHMEDVADGILDAGGAKILAEVRCLRPQIESVESILYPLMQQAGLFEALQALVPKALDDTAKDDRNYQGILVASTQPSRRTITSDAAKNDLPLDIIQSSGQPIAQTPVSAYLGPRAKLVPAPAAAIPMLKTGSYQINPTPKETPTVDIFADDFDDDFDAMDDMLGAAQALEERSDPPRHISRPKTLPRQALSQISDNLRREVPRSGTVASSTPSKQYPWSKDVNTAMRKRFHMQGFRHNQLEAINATLSGRDAFVLMPTGGGKSLCYQLPSIVASGRTQGVTIVISPLLSLMQDQVDHLQKLRIQAFLINGESSREHKNYIYQALRDPQPEKFIQLLYVTPEMLGKSQVITEKFTDLYKRRKLARIVIDEAHCVSQWGHDFRPDYKALGEIRMQFPDVPVMALTATATENVKVDVIHNLKMDGCEVFTQSFNRPNLSYEVLLKSKGNQVLQDIADTITSSHAGQSGIIYCLSRKACENLAKQLQSQYSIEATHYHAGMDPESRLDVQKKWQSGYFHVIVATIAFGMGIDKPDVRFVIHHTMPKSLEGYYQETGRAGRDGKESSCYLYYGYGDTTSLKRMIEDNKDASWQQKERQKQMLRNVVQFCENRSDCRRVQVLAYFNEHFARERCHATCDNCKSESSFELKDFSDHAKNIIKLVEQLQNDSVTLLHCADVYRGASNKKIVDMGHKSLKQFGMGSVLDRGEVERLLYRLISDDAIEEKNKVNRAGFATAYVILGQRYRDFIHGNCPLKIQVRTSPQTRTKSKITTKTSKKRTGGTGVQTADDFPASTNVSSPIERRTSSKRRKARPVVELNSDYDEEGNDFEAFAPIREIGKPQRSKVKPLGPPITTDDSMALLDDARQYMLQFFVDNATKELREIAMQQGLRQRPLSDTVLREIGVQSPSTLADLRHISGLTLDKIKHYGPLLLKHVKNARLDYEAIVQAQGGNSASPSKKHVVEISDDDLDEENFISDDDLNPDESEFSHYFNQAVPVSQNFQPPGPSVLKPPRKASQSRSSKSGSSTKGRSYKSRGSRANSTAPRSGIKKRSSQSARTNVGSNRRGSGNSKRGATTAKLSRSTTQPPLIGMMPT